MIYHSGRRGLPLGNLTSQLLVNIYMNDFDLFVKHRLKVKAYIRYADDFIVLFRGPLELARTLSYMKVFLRDNLKLKMHPKKVSISTPALGVDFLGWVHFTDHRVLRTTSKRRMLRRLKEVEGKEASLQSYLGLLRHGNASKLRAQIIS
jgi:hypothetical protein